MAYFSHSGGTDSVTCIICNAPCKEATIMRHRVKCGSKPEHAIKFEKGQLERCQYDTNHIVKGGQMELHLEFCLKYQSQLVSEFQEQQRDKLVDEMGNLNINTNNIV